MVHRDGSGKEEWRSTDLKPLNYCVLWEHHPLLKIDETLAQLSGATTFSKLDANSSNWQVPLSESSKLLTTFIIPFRHYCHNKLPFGISSAPEYRQQRMSSLLEGLQGVPIVLNDTLIFGQSQAQHDIRLQTVLEHLSTNHGEWEPAHFPWPYCHPEWGVSWSQ